MSVLAKNTAARTAVVRDRKFALPLAPNRLPEAPLPKAAPMSAPLPCCSRMRPIMPMAVSIWTASTMVVMACIKVNSYLFCSVRCGASGAAGGGDDLQEIGDLERSTAHESAVDVGLRQQGGGVGGVHAAAVQDVHALGVAGGRRKLLAQQRMHLLRLLRRRRL